jgi:hypothetical protein
MLEWQFLFVFVLWRCPFVEDARPFSMAVKREERESGEERERKHIIDYISFILIYL